MMNAASFKFLGSIPADEVSSYHYRIEAHNARDLALQMWRLGQHTQSMSLRRYADRCERTIRRRQWMRHPNCRDRGSLS